MALANALRTEVLCRRALSEGSGYKIVSKEVWHLLHDQYGGGPAITRFGISEDGSYYNKVEVHLRNFAVYKSSALDDPPVSVYMSQEATVAVSCTH